MPAKFAVVCEAEADFQLATTLAERLLVREIPWLQDALEACLLWYGLGPDRPFILWTDVARLAPKANNKDGGFFGGKPGKPDAHAGRRALLLLKQLYRDQHVDGVVFVRDDDRERERRTGLEQAREESRLRESTVIVIGLAHCKRESWVLAGFDAETDEESNRLAAVRQELGLDPTRSSHELTAKHDTDKKSAKRVLSLLTGGNHDREARCWRETDLDILSERGRENGLTAYLNEVRERLVTVFQRHP